MEKLTEIAKLLGKENEQRLKDRITDLLIEQVEKDLECMDVYLIDFECMMDEIGREIDRKLKEEFTGKYMEKARKKFSEFFDKLD